MVNNEYSIRIYGTVTRNPEMLKFATDHPKSKKVCKHAVKKITFHIFFKNKNKNIFSK